VTRPATQLGNATHSAGRLKVFRPDVLFLKFL
jgi:hypothetical protein